MKHHLVICGTGRIGAMLTDILLGKALRVRATTHRKWLAGDRAPLAWAYVDLATGEGIEPAFLGVDRVFLTVPACLPQPQEMLSPLIAEARRRKVEKVVLMTPVDGDGKPLRRCEEELERTGLMHDIIRPDPRVDPRDIAALAARLLTREDLGGRIIPRESAARVSPVPI